MMSRRLESFRRVCFLCALCALWAPALRAHNFWIEPSTFTPAVGQRVAVRLRVGQELKGDPVPRDPSLIKRFVIMGPAGGEAPVPGVPNTEPAGFPVFQARGLSTIIYDSGRSTVALEAAKFEQYLKEEGLERISALRARRGQSAAGEKEVFSRCAKALLLVGGGVGGAGAGWDRVLGQRLELVAEKNPYALAGGGELPVRLLYEGKPLAGALVMALQRDRPDKVTARSDAQGRVVLKLDRPGFWLIKAVHMIPAPRDAGADWESFWASLTFALPSR
ncbi:MAG TPA: DUF4198 domain-containing protein [Thermoanaerobaculia bacterium]|jgi:uncharacterized GH25 family protein